MEFKTGFSHNVTSNKAFGSLDIKYRIPKYGKLIFKIDFLYFDSIFCFSGMTLTEKWNTDNTLVTEVAVDDQIAKGLKTVLDTSYSVPVG